MNIPGSNFDKRFFYSVNARNGLFEIDTYINSHNGVVSVVYKIIRFLQKYNAESGMGLNLIEKIIQEVRHIDESYPVQKLTHLNVDSGWRNEFKISTGKNI